MTHNHEQSGSYNKPASVMHWVREADVRETYVLFIDADMLLRAPINPVELGVRRGLVVSEHVGYLDNGIRNHLVENFVPDASMASLARAAGWYHVFHLEDLKTIAPRWLHYCEQVRSNPQRYWDVNGSKAQWNAAARQAVGSLDHIPTGDAYVQVRTRGARAAGARAPAHAAEALHMLRAHAHARLTARAPDCALAAPRVQFGEAPWISEMYGYVFAAAEAGIDTKLLHGLVQYTDFTSARPPPHGPLIIHYGLHCHVGEYHFTKCDGPTGCTRARARACASS